MTARAAIAARTRTTPAPCPPSPRGGAGTGTEGVPAALGINHGQLALYVLTAACVASDWLIRFAEGTQDFIFFFAVETNVFVDWHRYLPYLLYIDFSLRK